MRSNLSQVDKGIRVFVSILIADLFFTGIVSGLPGILLLMLSAALIITSFVGRSPVYEFFGRSSKKKSFPDKYLNPAEPRQAQASPEYLS